jgi:hypothetical protein
MRACIEIHHAFVQQTVMNLVFYVYMHVDEENDALYVLRQNVDAVRPYTAPNALSTRANGQQRFTEVQNDEYR